MACKNPWDLTKSCDNYRMTNLYYRRLLNIAVARFKWAEVPDTIDVRFLELILLANGVCVFFKDDVTEEYYVMPCVGNNLLNMYGLPLSVQAYSGAGYNLKTATYRKNVWVSQTEEMPEDFDGVKGVLIWNNYLHSSDIPDLRMYAEILANDKMTQIVNVKTHKTPLLLLCDNDTRLTVESAFKKFDNNDFVIIENRKGKKDVISQLKEAITVLNTGSPMIFRELQEQFADDFADALEHLGIASSDQKAERIQSTEAALTAGAIDAARFSPDESRKTACEQINKMFNLNMSVDFAVGDLVAQAAERAMLIAGRTEEPLDGRNTDNADIKE